MPFSDKNSMPHFGLTGEEVKSKMDDYYSRVIKEVLNAGAEFHPAASYAILIMAMKTLFQGLDEIPANHPARVEIVGFLRKQNTNNKNILFIL